MENLIEEIMVVEKLNYRGKDMMNKCLKLTRDNDILRENNRKINRENERYKCILSICRIITWSYIIIMIAAVLYCFIYLLEVLVIYF